MLALEKIFTFLWSENVCPAVLYCAVQTCTHSGPSQREVIRIEERAG
jgi:hypothetical protein